MEKLSLIFFFIHIKYNYYKKYTTILKCSFHYLFSISFSFSGSLTSSVGHAGDLGNIFASRYGNSRVRIFAKRFRLSSVIGRGIVVHADRDDLGLGGDAGSLATGNAGSRLACCIIKRLNRRWG